MQKLLLTLTAQQLRKN